MKRLETGAELEKIRQTEDWVKGVPLEMGRRGIGWTAQISRL